MDAPRELAQLVERRPQLGFGLRKQLCRTICPGAELRAGELEREAQAEQPLLRAVVKVALEPPPLVVADLDDPSPRGTDLVELQPELRLQPLVLEREPRRGARRVEERALLEERRVVDERCDRCVRRAEHRHCAS